MATEKKVHIKLHLNDGKTAIINLPSPRNDTLVDDNSDDLVPDVMRAIAPVFASDDGATVTAADFYVVTTTTTPIVEDYFPED